MRVVSESARGGWLAVPLMLLVGCAPLPEPTHREARARSVLLITLDTTRADRIGAYGYEGARTPVIDGLARDGLLFEQARAPVPVTLPSHASLLTGVYPPAHGIQDNAVFELRESAVTLAEVLRARGLRTGAFVGSLVLDARFGLDQGFETYRGPTAATLGSSPELVERPAEEVVSDALDWLDSLERSAPFFAWVHLYDPHFRYQPPARFRRHLDDPYDGEIAYCDEQVGRLLEGIEQHGAADGLAVVLTADHGEALHEHGETTHGVFVYDATMHVPLIVRLPAGGDPEEGASAGRRVRLPVSIVDIAPTILELLGLGPETMPEIRVPSLLESLRSREKAEARPIYMESFMPYHAYRWHPLRAILWNGLKFIQGRSAELYRLGGDPREQNDLAGRSPDLCDRMRQRLEKVFAENGPLGWQEERVLNAREREAIQALGYAGTAAQGGGAQSGAPVRDEDLPDPRERIGDLALREEMREAMMEGVNRLRGASRATAPKALRRQALTLLARAREILDRLRAANPRDPSLDATLGALETFRGNPAEAVPALERAVLHQPTIANNHFNLALCYMQQGHPEWARREMIKAVSCEPTFAPAYRWLVDFNAGRQDFGRALWWFHEQERRLPGLQGDRSALSGQARRLEAGMRDQAQQERAPELFPSEDLAPEAMIAERKGAAGR